MSSLPQNSKGNNTIMSIGIIIIISALVISLVIMLYSMHKAKEIKEFDIDNNWTGEDIQEKIDEQLHLDKLNK